jgi:hypothetical protein
LWPCKGQNVKQKAYNVVLGVNPPWRLPYQGEFRKEHAMRHKSLVAGLAVVWSLSAAPALAAVCQGKSMTLDEIVDTINATPGCEEAMKVFKDCAFTASGDVQLGAAVEKKCESGFLGRLGASEKRTYQRKMRVCDRKYRNQSGTMYLSFTAFCRAEVAQRYSSQARKASGSKALGSSR